MIFQRDKRFSWLFKLKAEVDIFLQQQKKEELCHALTHQVFQLHWHIWQTFLKPWITLILNLQGNNTASIIIHHNAIYSGKWEQPWKCWQLPWFWSLAKNEDCHVHCQVPIKKTKYSSALQDTLEDKFICYFPDNFSNPIHKLEMLVYSQLCSIYRKILV